MADKVFLAKGGITVSKTRFVSSGDTYVMANVSSCRTRYTDETDGGKQFLRTASIVISIIVGIAIMGSVNVVVGLILGAIGVIAAMMFIKPSYQIFHLYL